MSTVNEWIKDGTKLSGIYCGVKFSGVVTGSRAHSMNQHQLVDFELDYPIVVFGDLRTELNEMDIQSRSVVLF